MSAKSKSTRYAQSRTDTLIGVGVRVAGNMAFTGVLRVQGEVLGDVSCDADSNGMLIVDQSGSVTGAIKAPHVVVSGRVYGSIHSSESIEIQPGAYIEGDALYKQIDIHAGGIIVGSLTPTVLTEADRAGQEHRMQGPELPTVKEYGMPLANPVPASGGLATRLGGARALGGIVALLVAVVALVWVSREQAPLARPPADVASKADSSAKEILAAPVAPAASGAPQDGQKAVAGDAAALVPDADVETGSVVQASPSNLPEMDQDKVVVVQGVNPGKPAGALLVVSNEPSVLFRKKRLDQAGGTRIDVADGATESIPIAKGEVLRVASGRDVQIFYQGRKVAPRIIESGAWMSFVPQAPDRTSDKK